MLARAHRVTAADDFRTTVRRGRRTTTDVAIVHRRAAVTAGPPRFGIVVSKKVGGAVVRNRLRRRVRAICAENISTMEQGDVVVIRMLPAAAEAGWDTLRSQISSGLRRAVSA